MELKELALRVNGPDYNKLKLLEEIHETGEVLVKTMTKKGKNLPPEENLIEELGDLIVRAKILAYQIGEDRVNERIAKKEATLHEYYKDKEQKYPGLK